MQVKYLDFTCRLCFTGKDINGDADLKGDFSMMPLKSLHFILALSPPLM